uniref:Uncharacterized protein n=1 Tax=Lotharella globosa TaxID=91324 RepID=A0A7S3YW52_9EUKA
MMGSKESKVTTTTTATTTTSQTTTATKGDSGQGKTTTSTAAPEDSKSKLSTQPPAASTSSTSKGSSSSSSSSSETMKEVLDFWFGPAKERWEPNYQHRYELWFSRRFDSTIRAKFAKVVIEAGEGQFQAWGESPLGCVALVILLDQLQRNLNRGSNKMFAHDSYCQVNPRDKQTIQHITHQPTCHPNPHNSTPHHATAHAPPPSTQNHTIARTQQRRKQTTYHSDHS